MLFIGGNAMFSSVSSGGNDGCSYFGDCCGDYEQECAPHSQASHVARA